MKLSVIIPTKNRIPVFEITINNVIKALNKFEAEIIIINDSKTSMVVVPKSKIKTTLINNKKDGVASARNLGAKNATGDLFLFLDDDIIIEESNITSALKIYELYPEAAINLLWQYPVPLLEKIKQTPFGRFLIRYGFTSMKEGLGNEWRDELIIETKVAASFFLLMHRKTFLNSGGYNENYPHAGSEDYDFSMRLKENGTMRILFTGSIVYHNEIDRIKIENWLNREQAAAETKAWGYFLGRNELILNIPLLKRITYTLLAMIKDPIIFVQKHLPSTTKLDTLNHRLIHLLLGTSIFQGYNKGIADAKKKNK